MGINDPLDPENLDDIQGHEIKRKHSDLQNCSVLLLQVNPSGTDRMGYPVKWFSVLAVLESPGKIQLPGYRILNPEILL